MADKDARPDDGPSLELPSLGFGRRRRRREEGAVPDAVPDTGATPEAAQTEVLPEQPAPEPAPTPEPAPEPEPVREPVRATRPAAAPEPPARPLFADEAPTRVDAPLAAKAPPTPLETRPRRTIPPVAGGVAALLVGLLVGALTVGLTWGGLQGCEALRGTATCGDPGFLLLVAILVVMVLVGSALLRALRVEDPGSTSFLGVGLLAVVALLFLVDVLFDWWMVIAIPVASMLTFALSRWVTTTFADADPR